MGQDNLSFYSAFLFQIVFLYVSIALLRKARRLVRASALDELLPRRAPHEEFCEDYCPEEW